MAAGNATLYTTAAYGFGIGRFNLASDNFNVVLVTNSYVPSPNTDSTYANISANEVAAGGGYSVGGQGLTGQLWTQSTGTITFAGQSVAWAGSTISARYAVLVRRAGVAVAPTDWLLAFLDLTGSGNGSSVAATFQVNWNGSTPSSANTIFTMTHNP